MLLHGTGWTLLYIRCIPNCILVHYSIIFCSINSAFTLKIPKRKHALNTRMMHLNNWKKISVECWTLILWGRCMLESDWLTNVLRCAIIFRETHGKRSSRQLSWPHYSFVSLMIYFKGLTSEKWSKPTTTLAKQINTVNKSIKIDRSCPCLATKLRFIMYLLSLSRSRSLPHRHTHTVVYTQLKHKR